MLNSPQLPEVRDGSVYYPEDISFLLYLDPSVTSYEVVVSPDSSS